MRMNRSLVFLASALVITACTTAPDGTADRTGTASHIGLDAYHWDLASATDVEGQPIAALQPIGDKRLRLDFADGHVGVSGGCNRIGGNYRQLDTTLQVEPLMQTEMACADRRLMDLDAAIAQRLEGKLRAHTRDGDSPRLELVTGNGDRLDFAGTPTPQTRYGSAGTTMFFEVAPQRAPCSHPLIPNMQCLRVRERTYAENGTLGSQGEWQPLYQNIEGYTHVPGTRNVVRVKKFAVKNPPADASSVAYLLDMVVESEVVGR